MSLFWKPKLEVKAEQLKKSDLITEFRNNGLSRGIDNNYDQEHMAHRYFKDLFPDGFPLYLEYIVEDSTAGNPIRTEINGLQVTNASMEYIYMLNKIFKLIPFNATVCEIGGGFGGLARAITMTGLVKEYHLIDFTEHLTLQMYYLSRMIARGKQCNMEYKFHQAGKDPDKPIDVYINTRSMMEMDREEIDAYFDQIHKNLKPGGIFYLISKDKVTKVDDYPFDDKWEMIYEDWWPIPSPMPMMQWIYRRK